MTYLIIKVGYFILHQSEIAINKEEYLSDSQFSKKIYTELFIEKPQTFFGNMRKINVLFLGSGMLYPGTISSLAAANATVHVMNIPKQEDFVTVNKPDWEEINRRLMVYSDIEYREDGKNQSIFDFHKQSKRDRFRPDRKSQKLKAKHRRT